MVENKKDQPAPDKKGYKIFKIMTVSLFFILLFIAVGAVTVESTSSSSFCSSCHEMKPEFYTWQASSHSDIQCKECHIGNGVKDYAKAKVNGLKQVYMDTTNTYTAPIQMPTDVPNSACEKCHDMKTRSVTPAGDIIIPHDKHLTKGVKCVQCHSGVVHGNISDRNVTFKSDYSKWDDKLAKSLMTVNFTQPKMDTCIQCHKARDVSTACKTCHSTGMKPKSHDVPGFKTGNHGTLAEKDIKECNKCHQYMSDDDIKNIQNAPASQQFLNTGSIKQSFISAQDYAKENTFCKKCHTGTKPPSHKADFVNIHGTIAKADKKKCLACHNEQDLSRSSITSNGLVSNAASVASAGSAPACSSCHPASHEGNNFRQGHPIDLTGVTKPSAVCYTCHYKPKCTSCHKES
jgi:nitrate/TMAO reductase-like tetraheme cytochrome c subunit